jgi:hypothetical protein
MYDYYGWQDLQDMRLLKTTLMFRFSIFFFANTISSATLEPKNRKKITITKRSQNSNT